MAKRMIDTNFFKKGFVKDLSPEYKLLWSYLLLDCDFCGIWNKELDVASLRLGFDFVEEEVLKVFNSKIIMADTDKWFIPSFIEFQYGELNPNNRVHNSVLNNLKKYDLENFEEKNKPLTSPLLGAKDKDIDIDIDKDKVKDKEKEKEKPTKEKESGMDIFDVEVETEAPPIHGGCEHLEESAKKFLAENTNYIWETYDSRNLKPIYDKIVILLDRNKLPVNDDSIFNSFVHLWQLAQDDNFHSKHLTLSYLGKHFNKIIQSKGKKKKESLEDKFQKINNWT